MAIDVDRILRAAAQAALEDQGSDGQRRPVGNRRTRKISRLSAPRAVLIGAGTVTAGRLLARFRGREVMGRLQQRLEEYESRHLDGGDGDG